MKFLRLSRLRVTSDVERRYDRTSVHNGESATSASLALQAKRRRRLKLRKLNRPSSIASSDRRCRTLTLHRNT